MSAGSSEARVPTPPGLPLHDLVRRAAAQFPERTAVTAADGDLTYAELDAAAEDLAARLCDRGVGPGSIVGLYVERSRKLIVGLLGILRSGGAYLPLDPSYPPLRTKQIVEEAAPALVAVSEETDAAFAAVGGTCATLGIPSPGDLPRRAGAVPPGSGGVGPGDPAYVIFTSGSTGRPKGVVVEHRNATWSTLARHEVYADHPPRSFLLLSSVAFDSSVAGIFWTLSSGGTLVVAPADLLARPEALAGLAAEAGVTHLLTVPTLYGELVDHLTHEELELVVVAGEECSPALVERHHRARPDVAIFNEYGPTEATVWASVARLEAGRAVTLGVPVPGARILVLDEERKPVPRGEAGELWIGGPGVCRGYLNRPDLTEERFHALGGDPAERFYRTGDRGRIAEDGEVVFLGRVDRQVKLGGVRIELGEIEAVLCEHRQVGSAAAVVDRHAAGGRIAAFVTARPGAPAPDEAALFAWAASRLPPSMVPARIALLDRLPALPNGKVDHGALERLAPTPAQSSSVVSTESERLIADLCHALLDLDPDQGVGPADNFFALGGHSLMLMRLRHRIKEETGKELVLRQMMMSPTVEGFAQLLDAAEQRVELSPSTPPAGG
jgi:amino acid adenylation domain-containing protein